MLSIELSFAAFAVALSHPVQKENEKVEHQNWVLEEAGFSMTETASRSGALFFGQPAGQLPFLLAAWLHACCDAI